MFEKSDRLSRESGDGFGIPSDLARGRRWVASMQGICQHLLVNDSVAVVAAQYLYKLMHRVPVTSFLSYISSDGIGIWSIPITKDELSAYLVRGN